MKNRLRFLMIIGVSLLFILIQNNLPLYAQETSSTDIHPIPAEIQCSLDQKTWTTFQHPLYILDGHTLISSQDLALLLDCQLYIEEPYSIKIIKESTVIYMVVELSDYERNGQQKFSHCPPVRIGESIYLPLRELALAMNYKIEYNVDTKTVEIYRPGFVPPPSPPQPVQPVFPGPAKLGNWGNVANQPYFASLWPEEKIIGGYYTRLINSPAGRTKNIELSLKAIDGTVLPPGHVFSFNRVVGQRTAAKGYQYAPIFAGQQVVPGIGGGICQTSSTLYNAALIASLPILERHPHSMPVNYVPPGRDASISWGSADLKFKNNRPLPITIRATILQGYVVVTLLEKNG
ncbi:MAG TPA: hypothetical protein GX404_09000 [Syntrophomonadaceae bacterium]|jgi:hypothetical protein|nr:hypothetical protein [Syntrophomonadaceae bacterium]